MSCPCRDGCRLFGVLRSEFALVVWQRRYCEVAERFPECARLAAAAQGQAVPDGMLPNGYVLATAG